MGGDLRGFVDFLALPFFSYWVLATTIVSLNFSSWADAAPLPDEGFEALLRFRGLSSVFPPDLQEQEEDLRFTSWELKVLFPMVWAYVALALLAMVFWLGRRVLSTRLL